MQRFRHGLVIGRFAPFHGGHDQLVRFAVAHCDRVTVQVTSRRDEEIPATVRAGWVRTLHPDVRVVLVDRLLVDDVDDQEWRLSYGRSLVAQHDQPVDAVFGGSQYSEEFAHEVAAQWLSLDDGRRRVPVSSARVRATPERFWSLLPSPVRAWYVRRIAVLGADTGRSTELSLALAHRLGCGLVACAARDWLDARADGDDTLPDLQQIELIRDHQRELDRAGCSATPNQWLVCQGDHAFVHAWRSSREDEADQHQSLDARPSPGPARLYVLDASRESTDQGDSGPRRGLVDRLRTDLTAHRAAWVEVAGTLDERVAGVLHQLPETRFQPMLAD